MTFYIIFAIIYTGHGGVHYGAPIIVVGHPARDTGDGRTAGMSSTLTKILDFIENDMSYRDYYLSIIAVALWVPAAWNWSFDWAAVALGATIAMSIRLGYAIKQMAVPNRTRQLRNALRELDDTSPTTRREEC